MSNFSKYFTDEVNDSNWEVMRANDGSYCILANGEYPVANGIAAPLNAYMIVNAQRFFWMLDKKQREIFLALIKAERAEEGTK